ncbi:recombination-associated protein RdgC [Bordetella bronchialis]|uniref:Recombination-associated protein RdgC n=1 Tax=Bordetella bronchialis TaxID=463025 RepID=A0A193FT08_9BORD|nr:recombination-associated protein RdgC [Bordetella bronchialis]ANN70887.1 recombination-associated protein RdgC [Bordetella bronchialis]
MWFKNLKVYRLSASAAIEADALGDALAKRTLDGAVGLEFQSLGWVPPLDGGNLVHSVGGQILLTMRTRRKLLPATVINQVARARAAEVEEQQGYRPGRKQMKEIKERVTDELLPKAFSVYRDTQIWIDPKNRWLVIDAGTDAKADEALSLLAKCVAPFPVESLHVHQSPAAAMTLWLESDDPPVNFSIDQDTELRATGASQAKIRYVKQSIDADDASKHIRAGKQCTRLALTWADRVSFVLTDSLDLKRITPLDVLKEPSDVAQNDAERFDSDFTLMTGELAKMLGDLVHALGGEQR